MSLYRNGTVVPRSNMHVEPGSAIQHGAVSQPLHFPWNPGALFSRGSTGRPLRRAILQWHMRSTTFTFRIESRDISDVHSFPISNCAYPDVPCMFVRRIMCWRCIYAVYMHATCDTTPSLCMSMLKVHMRTKKFSCGPNIKHLRMSRRRPQYR